MLCWSEVDAGHERFDGYQVTVTRRQRTTMSQCLVSYFAVKPGKPATPTIQGRSNVTDGSSSVLTCVSNPPASPGAIVTFFLNGVQVSSGPSSSYKTSVVGVQNTGDYYTCKVTENGVASDESNRLTLKGIHRHTAHTQTHPLAHRSTRTHTGSYTRMRACIHTNLFSCHQMIAVLL